MTTDTLILVAGGDPTDRETILQALGDDFHVVAAVTIDDALAHANDTVGLVICDLDSTQLNGLELVQQWKSRRPDTPFLAITAGRDVSSAVEAMKIGFADCLVKPVDQDDLRSAALEIVNDGTTLDERVGDGEAGGTRGKTHIDIPPGTSLEELERVAVEQALVQHHGNRTHAAKTLGISVRTLQRKLKSWGMPILAFPNAVTNHPFVIPPHAASHSFLSTHVH